MIVSESEAKINLSKLIDRVYRGETIVTTKNNLPITALVAYKLAGKCKLGLLKCKVSIPKSFNDEVHGINELFYGN